MPTLQTRRRFLTTLSWAGAASLLGAPPALAAEGPPETTTVRIVKSPAICIAPQYVAEELLRAEGFTDVRYIEMASTDDYWEAMGGGKVDFSLSYASNLLTDIDGGAPIRLLAGVMAGCFELFARGGHPEHRGTKGQERRQASSRIEQRGAPHPDGRPSRA